MTEHALLTVEEMYCADAQANFVGISTLNLMENAGQAVTTAIEARWTPRPTTVLCGPGNNGGDGFVVARLLAEKGWPIRLGLLCEIAALKGDTRANAMRWRGEVNKLSLSLLDGAELIVDAIFGAGLKRPIDGIAASIISAINQTTVSIDIPSGVHGNTGRVMGVAPQAATTVTFFRAKPGHYLIPGRQIRGELVVADIGIPGDIIEKLKPQTHYNGPDLWRTDFPVPHLNSHKYTRGHAVVVGGDNLTGAARLAARAARRIGAGLVTITASQKVFPIYAQDNPGHLVNTQEFSEIQKDPRITAVLIGPGTGVTNETAELVRIARQYGKPVVIDADALTVFNDNPRELFSILDANCILTPHNGEFNKLFKIPGDRLERSRKAAAACGAIILLKGPDTIIAAPSGHAVINNTGTPYLATAGSGDVLAGIIVGLMAQGMPAFKAAQAGAWVHGRAAEIFGPGLISEDLPEQIPKILGELSLDSVLRQNFTKE